MSSLSLPTETKLVSVEPGHRQQRNHHHPGPCQRHCHRGRPVTSDDQYPGSTSGRSSTTTPLGTSSTRRPPAPPNGNSRRPNYVGYFRAEAERSWRKSGTGGHVDHAIPGGANTLANFVKHEAGPDRSTVVDTATDSQLQHDRWRLRSCSTVSVFSSTRASPGYAQSHRQHARPRHAQQFLYAQAAVIAQRRRRPGPGSRHRQHAGRQPAPIKGESTPPTSATNKTTTRTTTSTRRPTPTSSSTTPRTAA